VSFLLTEGGGYLLQESGDRILLEYAEWASIMIPGFPVAPQAPRTVSFSTIGDWIRRVVDVVNGARAGKLNATVRITLAAGATSTTVIDPRITWYSALLLTPVTADAAAIAGSTYVNSQQNGQCTFSHPSSASGLLNFTLAIIG